MVIPAIDSQMEPIIMDFEPPFEAAIAGKYFGYDPLFDIAKKCNELGMNGVRVTQITRGEYTDIKDNVCFRKIRVKLDVEAAR